MTFSEFQEYFEKVEKLKKEEWSEWMPYSDGKECWQFRSKGKLVEVEIRGGFKGRASCSPTDTFDMVKGIKLASARAKVKQAEDVVRKVMNQM